MISASPEKRNQLFCPYPYVTKVMFHDIHPDSETCQPEVLTLSSCMSIWTAATSGSWKTGQDEEVKVKAAKSEKNSLYWLNMFPFQSSLSLISCEDLRGWHEACKGVLSRTIRFKGTFIHPSL